MRTLVHLFPNPKSVHKNSMEIIVLLFGYIVCFFFFFCQLMSVGLIRYTIMAQYRRYLSEHPKFRARDSASPTNLNK
jgi:hypothetical protein